MQFAIGVLQMKFATFVSIVILSIVGYFVTAVAEELSPIAHSNITPFTTAHFKEKNLENANLILANLKLSILKKTPYFKSSNINE